MIRPGTLQLTRSKEMCFLRAGALVTALALFSALGAAQHSANDAAALLGQVLEAHTENMDAIQTVEGEALMRLYWHWRLKPTGATTEVTKTVWIRYAWDKRGESRWSEYNILDCFVNGKPCSPGHPEFLSSRHFVDRTKHMRSSGQRLNPSYRVLSAASAAGPASQEPAAGNDVIATIAPLKDEVEADMELAEATPSIALVYDGWSPAFDIRFYFSAIGLDVSREMKFRVSELDQDPDCFPGLAVRKVKVDGDRLIEVRWDIEAPPGVENISVCRYDAEQGGNCVYAYQAENGLPRWESTHRYYYVNETGVWFPSSANIRLWRADEDGGNHVVRDMVIQFGINTCINKPWAWPVLSTIQSLGLRKGDLVIDEITGKRYRYGEE